MPWNRNCRISEIDFPHVAELAPYLARCEFATEFAFGLDIIIDGLNTQLVARR